MDRIKNGDPEATMLMEENAGRFSGEPITRRCNSHHLSEVFEFWSASPYWYRRCLANFFNIQYNNSCTSNRTKRT